MIFVLLISCVGCMRMDLGIDIREDGTASMVIKMSIEESVYNMMTSFGGSSDTEEESEDSLNPEDVTKETIDGETYYSYQETMEFASYQELIDALKDTEAAEGSSIFDSVNVVAEEGDKYKFSFKTAIIEAPADSDMGMEIPDDWFTLTMTVRMPGKVTDTNGEIMEDGSVRFKMNDFTENADYFVHSEVKSDNIIPILIGTIAASVLLIFLSFTVLGGKKKKEEEKEDKENKKEELDELEKEFEEEKEESFKEEDMAATIEYKKFSVPEEETEETEKETDPE